MAAASGSGTLERPKTKAKVRYLRMSASKARVVLNLIRNKQVGAAMEILEFSERLAAEPIAKCLRSAVANAEHNEDIPEEELFVSACYADQGPTLKRFRPRARGRAGRIHKQTCHITIEVSRLSDDELDEARRRSELKDEGRQSRASSKKRSGGGDRSRRVAKSRAAEQPSDAEETSEDVVDDIQETEADVTDTASDVDSGSTDDSPTAEAAVEDTTVEDTATEDASGADAEVKEEEG